MDPHHRFHLSGWLGLSESTAASFNAIDLLGESCFIVGPYGQDVATTTWVLVVLESNAGTAISTIGTVNLSETLDWYMKAVYDRSAGSFGEITVTAAWGHPDSIHVIDSITHAFASLKSYDVQMAFQSYGLAGTRRGTWQIQDTYFSFDVLPPTTLAPTTPAPTTLAPTTVAPTLAPTTLGPTTVAPTLAPTTLAPTTLAPTTLAPITAFPPVTPAPAGSTLRPNLSTVYKPASDTLYVRAWVEDGLATTLAVVINPKRSFLELLDEDGLRISYVQGEADGAGPHYVRFRFTGLQVGAEHNYVLRASLAMPVAGEVATGTFPMPTGS
jgi:hypothetical protein